jgi:tetratricopeptide (TPR) repeat protein
MAETRIFCCGFRGRWLEVFFLASKMRNDTLPVMEPINTQGSAEHQNQPEIMPAGEYLKAARAHLRSNRRKEAYGILLQASVIYPDQPLILSYRGWLQAVVDKKYKSGLAACRRAFVLFKTSDPNLAGRVYPNLFLNLGRTLLIMGRKKDAVENFRKGLQYDRGNQELKKEMQLLGERKKPPIPFFSRSNFLNLLIGKLFHANPKNPKATR